jgi:hypothetical protein
MPHLKKKLQFLPYGRSIGSRICLTHKTYTCHTVQNITDTHNIATLYIDGCLGFHDILVYWNESTLYNFRTSYYVQQRKTYMRKAATVHLKCSTVPCNMLCTQIAAAVWCKTRDVICDLQSAQPWDAVPWCKTYPCQNTRGITFVLTFVLLGWSNKGGKTGREQTHTEEKVNA